MLLAQISLHLHAQAKANSEPKSVAASAESRKTTKYCNMDPSHLLQSVAIKISDKFGPETLVFWKELGLRVRRATSKKRSFPFLTQQIVDAI